ncbi:hypothetical protein [Hydrogenovibrio kuenenii]|uniref:hypothetical protein n=1 Tax=Hydrogenovibrio kuenenii TaxID=63658 RepID=UPI0004669ABA|nr:hypothetical protein [Hydrogenovibrio kuenenii]
MRLSAKLSITATFVCLSSSVFAAKNNINYLNFSSQDQFKHFSTDLTGVLAYKSLRPTEPLGLIGFDIGISGNSSSLKYKDMGSVSSNSANSIDTVTLHAVKGLPLGIDVGVDYMTTPNSNLSTWSGNMSWAFFDGGILSPSIGINGHYTQTSGISALDYKSYGMDLGVSKGILNMTPFASVGIVNSEVKPLITNQVSGVSLQKVTSTMTKIAAGVNINLLFMDVLVAYNQIGDVPTYSIKAGYRF